MTPASVFLLAVGRLGGVELGVGSNACNGGMKMGVRWLSGGKLGELMTSAKPGVAMTSESVGLGVAMISSGKELDLAMISEVEEGSVGVAGSL